MDRNKMIMQQILKYSIFILFAVTLYILQTIPGFLNFSDIKPSFILPFCIVLTFFDYETPMLSVYIIAGFLNEMAMTRMVGFHTILLITLAVIGNIISTYYFNPNIRNTTIYSFISLMAILSIDFFFVYFLQGHQGLAQVYLNKVVITSVVSLPFCFLYYYFITFISNKFVRYDAR